MKHTITAAAIFLFVGLAVFINGFIQARTENYQALVTAGQTADAKEVVFSSETTRDDEIYRILTTLLREYRGNLL